MRWITGIILEQSPALEALDKILSQQCEGIYHY